ncbi:unnamed protein product [Symbiodinium sp. CCMP2592]|nr:unnamed protein product [Symbiodinium sp. CCMP2592]
MAVIERKVMICGPSGSGKSFVSNKLTLLPVPKTSQQEEDPNYGVISSSTFGPCSTRVLTKRSRNPVKYYLNSRGDEGQMTLYVTDTPGVPDTKGRSVNFLNEVMSFARESRPHGIVWVVDAVGRFGNDMELALQAAKECWNGQLTESKLHVFVNRVPSAFSLANDGEEEENIEQVQAEKVDAAVRYVVKCLLGEDKVEGFRNYSWNLAGSHEGIKTLKLAIAKFDTPLTDQQAGSIRTWDELNTYYEDLETGAISAKEFQEQQLSAKQFAKQYLVAVAGVAKRWPTASFKSLAERIGKKMEEVDGEIQRLQGDHEKELEREKKLLASSNSCKLGFWSL